jgi:hypothetical protein
LNAQSRIGGVTNLDQGETLWLDGLIGFDSFGSLEGSLEVSLVCLARTYGNERTDD